MQIGIIGLPYSGKTTLFQTLTGTLLGPDAVQKRDANQAVVKVPDARLDALTEIFNPKKKVNAVIDFVDFAGVQKGDSAGSAFNSQFMAKVKTNDAILHVARGFEDDAVPHIEGNVNLIRDIRTLEEEFIFADMAFVESRLEKLAKDLKKPKDRDKVQKEIDIMKRWQAELENETPLREVEMSDEEQLLIKNYAPLSAKPLLIALNLSEDDVAKAEEIQNKVKEEIKGKNVAVEPFFAKIEMELLQLSDDEKEMFMEEYGLTDSPLSRLLRSAYALLGLQSFFTVGEDECRAWTIRKGMNAQESSGVIHTDFYNKFIRAEVVSYNDFMEHKSMQACKEKGLFRLEGKEYIVNDGDIINVRHG